MAKIYKTLNKKGKTLMTLTKIEYGSVASSEVVNNNFQYLDDKISSVSQSLSANTSALSGTISSLSSTIAANKEEQNTKNSKIEENIDTINSNINNSSIVKSTYKNGYDWYRLYSDNWVEQGGSCTISANGSKTISLKVPMADNYYSIIANASKAYYNSSWDIGVTGATIINANSIQLTYGREGGRIFWKVCGFAKNTTEN